jgi:hypothetical protein
VRLRKPLPNLHWTSKRQSGSNQPTAPPPAASSSQGS